MAKNSVRDYSATNADNTDIQSIDISEGCSPAGINNAVREVMVDLKNVSTGAVALETPSADQLNVDNLRLDGNTISSTDTNGDITIDPDGSGDTIVASGNLGIGTSSPSDALTVSTSAVNGGVTVSGSTDPQYFLNSSGGNQARFKINDASPMLQTGSWTNIPVGFYVNGSERMRIDSSGKLLLGTTSVTSGILNAVYSGAYGIDLRGGSGASTLQLFFAGATNVGSISTNGTSTAFNTASDYRLKENVTADWDATTRLKQLNPVRFNFIADADTTVDGFLAHEAQAVVPECVSGTYNEVEVWQDGEELPDGVSVGDNKLDDDGNTIPVYQGIDQSKLVPLLVKTIQELEARITALEAV